MSVSLYGSGQTVIQAVSANNSTQTSTTSTTPIASPITASITPQSTTSKILAQVNGTTYNNSAGQYTSVQIYRGTTALGTFVISNFVVSGAVTGTYTISFLDSPTTTSSTAYTLYFYVTGATGYVNYGSSQATITLMEISGS